MARAMRRLYVTSPLLEGDDVRAVQQAVGVEADGLFGPVTEAAVRAWKWKPGGFPRRRVNGRLGVKAQRWLLGELPLPASYIARAARRGQLEPYPIVATEPGPGSEFRVPDPEGAPGRGRKRYHAAKDWFAPARSDVRSPVSGRLVEVRRSRRRRGQVFGGTVKVQADLGGRIWVLRHVDPVSGLRTGDRVEAGEPVARVTPWRDGSPHVHVEVWKRLDGGYRLGNMIDPMTLIGG